MPRPRPLKLFSTVALVNQILKDLAEAAGAQEPSENPAFDAAIEMIKGVLEGHLKRYNAEYVRVLETSKRYEKKVRLLEKDVQTELEIGKEQLEKVEARFKDERAEFFKRADMDIAEMAKEREEHEEKMAKMKEQVSEFRRKAHNMTLERDGAHKIMKEDKEEIRLLQGELRSAQRIVQQKKDMIEARDGTIEDLRAILETKDRETYELGNFFTASTRREAVLVEEVGRLNEVLKKAAEETDKLRTAVADLEATLREKEEILHSYKQRYDDHSPTELTMIGRLYAERDSAAAQLGGSNFGDTSESENDSTGGTAAHQAAAYQSAAAQLGGDDFGDTSESGNDSTGGSASGDAGDGDTGPAPTTTGADHVSLTDQEQAMMQLQTENESCQAEKERLRKDLANERDNNDKLKKEKEALEAKIAMLEREVDVCRVDIESLQEQGQLLTEDYEAGKARIAELEKLIQEQDAAIADLNNRPTPEPGVSKDDEDKGKLLEDLTEQLQKAKQDIVNLNNELEETQTQLDILHQEMADSIKSMQEQLENKEDQLERVEQQMAESVKDLTDQLERLEKEKSELEREPTAQTGEPNPDKDGQIKELEAQLKEKQDQLETLEQEKAELEEELNQLDLSQRMGNLEQDMVSLIEDLEKQFQEKQSELDILEQETTAYRNELQDQLSETQHLLEQAEHKNAELAKELTAQLEVSDKGGAELGDLGEEKQKQLEAAMAAQKELADSMNDLQAQLDEKQSQVERIQQEKAELAKKLEDQVTEQNAASLKNLEDQLNAKRSQLEQNQLEQAELTKKLEKLKLENADLIKNLKDQLEEKCSQLEELEQALKQRDSEAQAEEGERDQERKRLEDDNKRLEEENKRLADNNPLAEENKHLRAEVVILKTSVESLTADLASLKEIMEDQSKVLSSNSQQVNATQTVLEEHINSLALNLKELTTTTEDLLQGQDAAAQARRLDWVRREVEKYKAIAESLTTQRDLLGDMGRTCNEAHVRARNRLKERGQVSGGSIGTAGAAFNEGWNRRAARSLLSDTPRNTYRMFMKHVRYGSAGSIIIWTTFLMMVSVTIAEGRMYTVWRNANAQTRALYMASDDRKIFCVGTPDLDYFWDTVWP